LFGLAGCTDQPAAFRGSDISGTKLGQQWKLTDMNGQARDQSSFVGKVQLVFFGFAQCPDVCPTSLSELSEAMKLLGPDADRVQVLLVTVDPERDTPDLLRQYLSAFDPRFMGLTGTPEQVRQAASSFKAFYSKVPRPGGDYTMDHSASFYLLDRNGEARVLLSNNMGAAAIAHDIKALLK
jgi:protein SCO1/2